MAGEEKKVDASFFKDYQNLLETVERMKKDASNPFFKSKYVPLKSVLEEAKKVCKANNFIFIQLPDVVKLENKLQNVLRTKLVHTSGEIIDGIICIASKDDNDPQKVGAGLTYMRRYSLTCVLGIEEEDDDGNKASTPPKKKAVETPDKYDKGNADTNSKYNNFQKILTAIDQAKSVDQLTIIEEKLSKTKEYTAKQVELANSKINTKRDLFLQAVDVKIEEIPVIEQDEI